jgi:cell wall assembly regulator SMI1
MTESEGARHWGNVVLWGPFTPVTDTELDQVEQLIGRPLPRDYREFIAIANGGTLPYAVRLPPDEPQAGLIEFSDLYRATGDGRGTLIGEWHAFPGTFIAEQFPPPVLPVARDGGGSELLLDLRDGTHGTVLAFVHGLPAWAGGDGRDRGGVVAGSWGEYLALLTIDEEYARDVWSEARKEMAPSDLDWRTSVERWLDSGIPDWRSRPWA